MAQTPNGTEAVSSDVNGHDQAEPSTVENTVNRIFSNRERRLERRLLDQVSKTIAETLQSQMEPLRSQMETERNQAAGDSPGDELTRRLDESQRQNEALRRQYDDAQKAAQQERRARSEAELTTAIDRELLRRDLRHPDVLRAYFRSQCYVDDESGHAFIRTDESDRSFGEFLDDWSSQNDHAAFLPPLGRGGSGTTAWAAAVPQQPEYNTAGKSTGQVRQELLDGKVNLVDPFATQANAQ